MDIKHRNEGSVGVELSRRNLEHLLAALDEKEPGERAYLVRDTDQGVLWVYVAENDEHYDDRKSGPGFERLTE